MLEDKGAGRAGDGGVTVTSTQMRMDPSAVSVSRAGCAGGRKDGELPSPVSSESNPPSLMLEVNMLVEL